MSYWRALGIAAGYVAAFAYVALMCIAGLGLVVVLVASLLIALL